jgi:hypothetical protein
MMFGIELHNCLTILSLHSSSSRFPVFSIITLIMVFWTVGCVYGASAVICGAFGAHGLKKHIADPSRLANWSTAAQYQVRESHLSTGYL